jgi:hypothetical protein
MTHGRRLDDSTPYNRFVARCRMISLSRVTETSVTPGRTGIVVTWRPPTPRCVVPDPGTVAPRASAGRVSSTREPSPATNGTAFPPTETLPRSIGMVMHKLIGVPLRGVMLRVRTKVCPAVPAAGDHPDGDPLTESSSTIVSSSTRTAPSR